METTVDFLSNLYDFLFLQGFADLNEFGGIAALDGTIDVASIRQTHDDIPAGLFSKHLVGLGLVCLLSQFQRIVPVRHTKQQSLFVAFQSPHLQIAGTGYQWTVIVVDSVAQCVIVTIDLTTGFQ